MKARHPDIYPDRVCCVCNIQDEDNDHLWTCSANSDVCKQIWHDGLQQIGNDLYCDITPISLIKEWGSLFTSPPSIARQAIHKFVSFIETRITELTWEPRCDATSARERE
ncbi:hypothetical protein BGZ54_003270 [Gamsiella multidivaricata]|nr:hypothetical protein BGZ54_003270 [Gamsiella multidivaricata]